VVRALLWRCGVQTVAAALQQHGWQPQAALRFLGIASA
jgi:hypothetical protein